MVAVVLLALVLRVYHSEKSDVYNPGAGDAGDNISYALNLANRGTFGRTAPAESPVVPDAFRGPGYPLVLAAVIWPDQEFERWYPRMQWLQAGFGALTVLLLMLLAQRVVSFGFVLAAGLLLAGWPHAVSMTQYLLTETLFALLIVAWVWLLVGAIERRRAGLAATAGLVFGYGWLVNPILLPLGVLVALVLLLRRDLRRVGAFFLLAALALPLAWTVRSAGVPEDAHAGRAVTNLVQGSWPAYHWASTRPWHASAAAVTAGIDAEIASLREDSAAGLARIGRRMQADPALYLRWYALSKPLSLWAWDIAVGRGDIFVLETWESPYEMQLGWVTSIALAQALNAPLAVLAFGYSLLILVLAARRGLHDRDAVVLLSATTLVYVTLLHVVLQSEPRYGIPFRPLLILMAVAGGAALIRAAMRARTESRARYFAAQAKR